MTPSLPARVAGGRPAARSVVRLVAVLVLLGGVLALLDSALAAGAASTSVTIDGDGVAPATGGSSGQSPPRAMGVPAGAEVTVITTQGFFPDDESAELVAVTRAGTVVYYNDTYGSYFDVDPVEGTRYTVEYLAAEHIKPCDRFEAYRWCTRNVVERVNLSTGAVDRLHAAVTPRLDGTRWHDADRVNDTHLAIADIARDALRIVNLTSGETTWQWSATNVYDHGGGERPHDWTHLNDVEVLANDTYMLSMRNQDEVVFVRQGDGYLPERTLGEDGNHAVLYEQHNPDYIPQERGGPAVVVSDSENNRVLEYHRRDGRWKLAWRWRDAALQWPRDADRLPNGNTLIVDSHGDRVLEVTPGGNVTWSVAVGMPYDAERLGTGDESATGRAVGSRVEGAVTVGPVGEALLGLRRVLPSKPVNGAIFVVNKYGAGWFGFRDLVVTVLSLATLAVWTGLEYRWADWSVRGLFRVGRRRLAP